MCNVTITKEWDDSAGVSGEFRYETVLLNSDYYGSGIRCMEGKIIFGKYLAWEVFRRER